MSLNSICSSNMVKAMDNQQIKNNPVYIAPGGIHMMVREGKSNSNKNIELDDSPPEESVKPSVNFLFRSAADVYGNDAIGIILTGMGQDCADGAAKMSNSGAYIIAQDENSSAVWSMPKNAIKMGCVDEILPLSKISTRVEKLLESNRN